MSLGGASVWPMDWNKIVGANVRRLRVERKLTQEQLAHDAEIDLTYMGGIERGRRNPSVSVIGRIAASLGVTPAELLSMPPELQAPRS